MNKYDKVLYGKTLIDFLRKAKEMIEINLNDMLYAFSYALDCVEHEVIGVATNHGKRVAYLSAIMAEDMGMPEAEVIDLAGAAILHDNALTEFVRKELQKKKEEGRSKVKSSELLDDADEKKALEALGSHCILGEENIKYMPFRTDITGCILYHHENADGSGPFGKKAEETPLKAQIVHLADKVDAQWNLSYMTTEKYENIISWLKENEGIQFSEQCVKSFLQCMDYEKIYKIGQNRIDVLVFERIPQKNEVYTEQELMNIASLFAKIVDYKSEFTKDHSIGIAKKAKIMSEYYEYSPEKTAKMYFAGALHDIGKLVVDKDVLEKPGKLTNEEYKHIQNHAFASYDILNRIKGIEDITRWASYHHEKLDGSGYPFQKDSEELDKEERLMACLDIYQALTEKRPYKDGFSHEKTIAILREMGEKGQLDVSIIEDLDNVFSKKHEISKRY